jgi:hypothetical protein
MNWRGDGLQRSRREFTAAAMVAGCFGRHSS